MSSNFRFGWLSRRTLRALSRAIGPAELKIKGLDEHVIHHLEMQLRHFPWPQRYGLIIGMQFIEWAGPLGGWGLLPYSMLTREQATKRLYRLLESRLTPVRLLVNGLRVLICLAAYSHAQVEKEFGFDRRAWRAQRVHARNALLSRDHLREGQAFTQPLVGNLPPLPAPLYTPDDEQEHTLLAWDTHEHWNRVALSAFEHIQAQATTRVAEDSAGEETWESEA